MTATSVEQVRGKLQRVDGTAIRVLVVAGDPGLAGVLLTTLRREEWEVRAAADGASALAVGRDFRPDAVVLDVTLPHLDGPEVLQQLRARAPQLPVLLLTNRDAAADRTPRLGVGSGDDRLVKPFSPAEVTERVRDLLRQARVAAAAARPALVVGDLVLDEDSHEVRRGGERVSLTSTEFALLRYLMRNPKRVLSKAQILDRVWNQEARAQANVVELYISYLRKKVDAGRRPMIHTMRGAGYVLRPAS